MLTKEMYVRLARQMIQGEFLAILGTAIEALEAVHGDDYQAFERALRERGGADVTKMALMLRTLGHPSTDAESVDITDKVKEHDVLPRAEKIEMILIRSNLADSCDDPDHDHTDQENVPVFVFIQAEGQGDMPDLDGDALIRFNLIVEGAMAEIGCTPDEIADMVPKMQGAPHEAADVERDMSAKMRAEIDQEVAEFRTAIDADLDKMFGGGDSS